MPVIVVARDAPVGAQADFSRERRISHYEAGKLLFTDNFIQRVCESPAGLIH